MSTSIYQLIGMLSLLLILPTVQSVLIEGNNTIGNETIPLNESENITLECQMIDGELYCPLPTFVSYVPVGNGVSEPPEPTINLTFTKSDIEKFYTAENATGDAIQDIRAEMVSYRDYMKRMNENFESYINSTNKQLELFNETVFTVVNISRESVEEARKEARESKGIGLAEGIGGTIGTGVVSIIGYVIWWTKKGRYGW